MSIEDVLVVVVAIVAAVLAGLMLTGHLATSTSSVAVAASCPGRIAIVELPRAKYPHIVAHIEDSWDAGYPRTLRVNRPGADGRRSRLLGWWEARHPQPTGDGKDLDEEPAAVLRRSWKASVRPIAAHENRSAGATLGAQLRGVPNGACVRYDFGSRKG